MRILFALILAAVAASARGGGGGSHYALLAAGSSGFVNYRHQADICHAYHILRSNGIPATNIIVMMYDDVANDSYNPIPGTLFNHPANGSDAVNVYEGCEKNYTGRAVTASHFLAALSGNASGSDGGPVLNTGPDDDIFVYYSDHGGTGVSAFPSGPLLLSEDLIDTLHGMHRRRAFRKMVIYWESCESGSMFVDLPAPWNIYAMTASKPTEPSWGTYCPPDDVVNGQEIGSCLGDEFSVSWMEDSDRNGSMAESLENQFVNVHQETLKSNVSQFGDPLITILPVGDFEANQGKGTDLKGTPTGAVAKWSGWEAGLKALWWRWRRLSGPAADVARAAYLRELRYRKHLATLFASISRQVHSSKATLLPGADDVRRAFGEVQKRCLRGASWCEASQRYAGLIRQLARHDANALIQSAHALCPQ